VGESRWKLEAESKVENNTEIRFEGRGEKHRAGVAVTSEIYQVGGHVATRQTTFACLDFVVVVVLHALVVLLLFFLLHHLLLFFPCLYHRIPASILASLFLSFLPLQELYAVVKYLRSKRGRTVL